MGETILVSEGFRYSVMTELDISEVAHFISIEYFRKLPMSNYMQVPFKIILNSVLSLLLNEKVYRSSIKVTKEESNELIGTMIGIPNNAYPVDTLRLDTKKALLPVTLVSLVLKQQFFEITKLEVDKGISLNFAKILERYEGRKIMQKAVHCVELLASRNGYLYAWSKAITPRGQRLFSYCAYKVVIAMKFRDLPEIERRNPFIGFDGSAEVVYKLLSPNYRL